MAGANRILLVGAGRRAQATILPALHCLGARVDLVGVHTRTRREVALLGGAIRLTTQTDLGTFDLAAVDTVIVAVNRESVPTVLDTLAPHARDGVTLVLDTPVLERDQLASAARFEGWGRVVAGEDCVALPQVVLARQVVEGGSVGPLRHVELSHSGYRHHALASLRHLTGCPHPRRIRVTRWNPSCARLDLRYPGGVSATVLEPRDYEVGRMLVAGDRGAVADYPLAHKRVTTIGYRRDGGGLYQGLAVDGEPVPPSALDEAYGARATPDLPDPSLMGQLKIRGYMEVVAALDGTASPFLVDAYDSIHDNLALQIAERLGTFADPGLGRRSSLFNEALRRAPRLGGRLGPLGPPPR